MLHRWYNQYKKIKNAKKKTSTSYYLSIDNEMYTAPFAVGGVNSDSFKMVNKSKWWSL